MFTGNTSGHCGACDAVLKHYYQALRQGEARSAARTTIRMLESLVRVAQVRLKQPSLFSNPPVDLGAVPKEYYVKKTRMALANCKLVGYFMI
eukprot:559608-Pelagomonas_calceolata.AAC.2